MMQEQGCLDTVNLVLVYRVGTPLYPVGINSSLFCFLSRVSHG